MTARLVQAENYRKHVLFPGSTASVSPAEKLFNHQQRELLQRFGVVGKLPTTTGWQPVLPEMHIRACS